MNDKTNLWTLIVFLCAMLLCSVWGNFVQYNKIKTLTLEKHDLQDRVWNLEINL